MLGLPVESLRHEIPDLYLALGLAPKEAKPALALSALLYSELQRVSKRVSEPTIRLIRYAWWHEALGLYVNGSGPSHEYQTAFKAILSHRPDDLAVWLSLVEAHEKLDETGDTAAPLTALMHLWAVILSVTDTTAVQNLARCFHHAREGRPLEEAYSDAAFTVKPLQAVFIIIQWYVRNRYSLADLKYPAKCLRLKLALWNEMN